MTQKEIHVQIAADETSLLGPNATIPEQGSLFASFETLATQVSNALHTAYPGVYVWVEVRGLQNRTKLYGFPLEDEQRITEQIQDIIREVWEKFDWLTT